MVATPNFSMHLWILNVVIPLCYLLTPWSRVLLEKLTSKLCSWSRNSPHLWNPKVPHRTHKCPPTVPILRQLHPVPTTPSNFLKLHLNIIVLVSPMAFFPQASPPTPCGHLYPPPYAPHALPISFVSILPPAQYWVRSTDHSGPRYAAFSITLSPRPS